MKNIREFLKEINLKKGLLDTSDEKFVLDKSGTVMLDYVNLLSKKVQKTNSINEKLDLIAEQNTYLAAITALAYVK